MTARTHDLAAVTGLAIAVVIAAPLQPMSLGTAILAIFANLLGGVTPDIDQPTSPFWRVLPIGKYFGKLFNNMSGGHRFITHSVLGLVIFGFLSKLLLVFVHPIMPKVNITYVWWAFLIGMLSHLIMDTFTKEGVPWLLPIPVKLGLPPIKAWRITTGERVEKWVLFPALLVFNAWFYAHNYQQILNVIHHSIT